MIGPDQLLGFGLAALVLIVIPGPSVVFVVGRAVSYGQRVALASVLGNTAGVLVVMVLVCFGLGAVVAESQLVFTGIKLAGAAFLVWLGVQALRHRRELRFGGDVAVEALEDLRKLRLDDLPELPKKNSRLLRNTHEAHERRTVSRHVRLHRAR